MAVHDILHSLFSLDHVTFVLGVSSCILGMLLVVVCKYTVSRENSDHTGKAAVYSSAQCKNADCVRCSAKESLNAAIQERMKSTLEFSARNSTIKLSDRMIKSFKHYFAMTNSADRIDNSNQNVRASNLQNPSIFYMQNLSSDYCFEELTEYSEYDKVLTILKSSFEEVREEFDGLWSDFVDEIDADGWQENSLSDGGGKWFTFHLINQGRRQTLNMNRCPATSHMIKKVETLAVNNCIFGFVTFSVLMPGTHITSHCGATNTRIRCHLGMYLILP